MKLDIVEFEKELANKKPQDIIKWAVDKFGIKDIVFATSLGVEDQVITDMISKIDKNIEILTLDTGRLFPESYELLSKTNTFYGIKIKVHTPNQEELMDMVNKHGINLFYDSIDSRKMCCNIRKILPLKRALKDKKLWICGLRREQSKNRSEMKVVEWDDNFNLIKLNPLIDWESKDVWEYVRINNILYNPLHDKGFLSIGCQPCTRDVKEGEDERSGRWWWEDEGKKECGLHSHNREKNLDSPHNIEVVKEDLTISNEVVETSSKDHLDKLEVQSMFILREAYKEFKNLCMLWSIGKDSTVLLWLARKAFFGHVPFPLVHIDTNYKIPEMIQFRDRIAKEWKLDMVYGQNRDALLQKNTFPDGNCDRITCCKNLKSEALKHTLAGDWQRYRFDHSTGKYVKDTNKEAYTGVIVGVRSDEEGSRSKERYFSPRDKQNEWDISNQPPELWNQFKTDFAPGTHIRIHPLLDWTELNIWEYIERENIPIIDLYFDRGDGTRYRSLGCAPCTSPINSTSKNIRDIIEELKNGKLKDIAERSGRKQDKEDGGGLETLRKEGYM